MTRRKGMYSKILEFWSWLKNYRAGNYQKTTRKKSYWLTTFKKKINLDINEFHSIREVLLKCF
jgi:hypothetical protein